MQQTTRTTDSLDARLCADLDSLRAQDLRRELQLLDSPQGPHIRIRGRPLLNFASNDYLGLANEPAIKAAAIEAVERFGAGAGSSRLLSGSLPPHTELERTLAEFKRTEAALSFVSGYAAASGTICALAGKEDIVILDKLVHACIVDAARLSGATLRVYRHNDLEDLESILKWAAGRSRGSGAPPRVLVATESVFSMDGDCAPLQELVGLKEKYGASLMVDEAHATGLYGPGRRGMAEARRVSSDIEIQMGTLGKAVGSAGGFIAGSRALIELLINRARSFIFSTAPVPAAAAAAKAGIEFISSSAGEERCRLLWQRVEELHSALAGQQLGTGNLRTEAGLDSQFRSAIIPVLLGAEEKAISAARGLREQGLFVPAIRYPTVARNRARLRIALSAVHTAADIRRLAEALRGLHLKLEALNA